MSHWGPWYKVVKTIKGHRYNYDQRTRRVGRRILTQNIYRGRTDGTVRSGHAASNSPLTGAALPAVIEPVEAQPIGDVRHLALRAAIDRVIAAFEGESYAADLLLMAADHAPSMTREQFIGALERACRAIESSRYGREVLDDLIASLQRGSMAQLWSETPVITTGDAELAPPPACSNDTYDSEAVAAWLVAHIATTVSVDGNRYTIDRREDFSWELVPADGVPDADGIVDGTIVIADDGTSFDDWWSHQTVYQRLMQRPVEPETALARAQPQAEPLSDRQTALVHEIIKLAGEMRRSFDDPDAMTYSDLQGVIEAMAMRFGHGEMKPGPSLDNDMLTLIDEFQGRHRSGAAMDEEELIERARLLARHYLASDHDTSGRQANDGRRRTAPTTVD